MIIDGNNKTQTGIIANKCFYQTVSSIMRELEDKGYQNSADETVKVITAYHSLVGKKAKNSSYNEDYNAAFKQIDNAIETIAHQVFFKHENKRFDHAYKSFEAFDYINAILNRQHVKNDG
ncbi:MAG: hypothetical protein LBR70_01990 [Lactobacillaceae bacterium]|nr:hypothetical protein [Lactobacillaceae bacterium]